MSSSGYTHKIISYGDENNAIVPISGSGDAENNDGDIFAGMGAVVEYYDEAGNNVTPMPLMP